MEPTNPIINKMIVGYHNATNKCDNEQFQINKKQSKTIKLLSYNIANYQDWPNWSKRCQRITNIINMLSPDYICLQEVRNTWVTNMLDDVINKLKFDCFYCWKGCMTGSRNCGLVKYEEGNTIIQKGEKGTFSYCVLPLTQEDINIRIPLICTKDQIDIGCVHLTYDQMGWGIQLERLGQYMNSIYTSNKKGQILLGDFNIYQRKAIEPFLKKFGFKDLAIEFQDNQFTHSSWNPTLRLDRILYRGNCIIPMLYLVQQQYFSPEYIASDHLYIYAEFEVLE